MIPEPDTYEDVVAGADTFSDLVLWLKLGEAAGASTVADAQGSLTPFTVNGGVTFGEPGLPPQADTTCALFDGTNGYLSHAHVESLELEAGTFIVLLKPAASSLGANRGVFSKDRRDLNEGDATFYYFSKGFPVADPDRYGAAYSCGFEIIHSRGAAQSGRLHLWRGESTSICQRRPARQQHRLHWRDQRQIALHNPQAARPATMAR